MISENLASVKAGMADAARKSGRDPASVRLVAVTKTVAPERILQARDAGVDIFGENRIQEAREKIVRLAAEKIHWHFIGHLQKNKVKYLDGLFDLIHSIDSAVLAEAVHQKSIEHGRVCPVLIQVNVSGEASKFGVPPEILEDTLVRVSKLDGIRVRGLMTIAPYDPDPEKSRGHYSRLRELRDRCAQSAIGNVELDELSMGMSNDFTVAIEEGATLVRVGTAIFGGR